MKSLNKINLFSHSMKVTNLKLHTSTAYITCITKCPQQHWWCHGKKQGDGDPSAIHTVGAKEQIVHSTLLCKTNTTW